MPFGQPALALATQLRRRAARTRVPDEVANLDNDGGYRGELFRLVARSHEGGRDPEVDLRVAARCYRDLGHAWERSHHPVNE